jgi:uncharacterized membrane protein YdbT with pleckstrin-like domain
MNLLEGETLIWSGRPSWRSMLAFYITWGVFALVPILVFALVNGLADQDWPIWIGAVATVALLALVLFIGWVKRIDTKYTVTDHRITIRHGILSRTENSAHIDRVQNVTTHQSIIQRMLRVGNVDFDTAGTDTTEIKFVGIDDPRGLREMIAKAYGERIQELESPDARLDAEAPTER